MAQLFEQLLRAHIRTMIAQPREFSESPRDRIGSVPLDANENPFGSPTEQDYNRYWSPHLENLRAQLARIKRVEASQILLSGGTGELIGRIFSAFCEPAEDNVLICTPTSGLYERLASFQNVGIKKAPLTGQYQLDIEAIASEVDYFTKAIILCSPNNPTGNALYFHDIEVLLHNFEGLLIVDEAYVNFSRQRSLVRSLEEYPNLVVLQTLSIAWGLAGLRIAMAMGHPDLIALLNQLSLVHSTISQPAVEIALQATNQLELINSRTKDIVALRNYLAQRLEQVPVVEIVYPSDANFLLVKCRQTAAPLIQFLETNGILVGAVTELPRCMRITVGNLREIDLLLECLQRIEVL